MRRTKRIEQEQKIAMYKVRVETQFKVYHFFMESYEFMRLISKTDETEEFKVGEIHFLPCEIKSFFAEKKYMSRVTEADKDE